MKVAIIEDERPAAGRLERLLKEAEPDASIIAVLESVEETINWWATDPQPDLIFMDIQLEDGLCFEIFESIPVTTPVIFVTAFDEYAIRAFKVTSVDYLLKPLSRESLITALHKFKTLFNRQMQGEKVENMVRQLQPRTKERFLVKVGDHFRSIQTTDISCFLIRERYNFIFTREGREYPIDYSLDKVEKIIDPARFFRINRNFIINYAAIRDVIACSSSRLKVRLNGWKDDDDIIVSRERVGEFKEWMDR